MENREQKLPFKSSAGFAAKLKRAAFDEGLICYPMPGTRDGKNGDHVLLAPPFIAQELALDALDRAVEKTIIQATKHYE